MLEWNGEQRHHLPMAGRVSFGNGGFNKARMPAQTGRLSPVKYRGREKDGNRKAMAVRVRENARLSAPADGRVVGIWSIWFLWSISFVWFD
jgi:hypothetical protein